MSIVNPFNRNRPKLPSVKPVKVITVMGILGGFFGISAYNYLLFHIVIELAFVTTCLVITVIAYNTHGRPNNNYLTFLGIGLGYVGLITLLHTLTYKGMMIFPGINADIPTQFWIVTRYFIAGLFILSFMVMERKLSPVPLIVVFGLVTGILIFLVARGFFPTCFIEGTGLTKFKVISEYVICSLFIGAIVLLVRNRQSFHSRVYRFLLAAFSIAAVSDILFTLYVDVYGLFNFLGHVVNTLSVYYLYLALVETNLRRPYEFLFYELEQINRSMRQKTSELRLFAKVFEESLSGIVITDDRGTIKAVNKAFSETTGYTAQEAIGQNPRILKSNRHNPEFYRSLWASVINQGHWEGEIWNKRKNGQCYPEWLSINRFWNEAEKNINFFALFRDITADIRLRNDALLAEKIQGSLLPKELSIDGLTVNYIFRAYQYVSGDFFYYHLDAENQILNGYLLDVMGHGIATALQVSALHALFRQASGTEERSPAKTLTRINLECLPFFPSGSFAAAICFRLDLSRNTLIVSSAGINSILQVSQGTCQTLSVPGMYLGILSDTDYDDVEYVFEPGDAFIFLSDGLYEQLTDSDTFAMSTYQAALELLNVKTHTQNITDDASAIGIYRPFPLNSFKPGSDF